MDLLGLLDSFSVTDSLTDFVGELGVFFVDDLEGVLVGDFGIALVGDLGIALVGDFAGVLFGDFAIDFLGDFEIVVAIISLSTFSLQSFFSIIQKLEFYHN